MSPVRTATTSWLILAVAACALAGWIAFDTLRTIWPLPSPLPWFDEWATVDLLRAWTAGERSLFDVLASQHNEHRILFPRLVFFADDLLLGGQGRLAVLATFLVQALEAALFCLMLGRARPRHIGAVAVAGVVVALVFSLKQAGNFMSGFQLQFPMVLASATGSFMALAAAARRATEGRAVAGAMLACFSLSLVSTFSMANGLFAPILVVVLAVLARLPARIVLACLGWAALLALAFFHGYRSGDGHLAASLRHPLDLSVYTAIYLGNIVANARVSSAAGLGAIGITLAAAAVYRVATAPRARHDGLALVGVMLFVGMSATVTGLGRMESGLFQALSTRYVTASAVFWAAQLTYWWVDPPPRRTAGRGAVAMLGLVLGFALAKEQNQQKPALYAQAAAARDAENLALLGFDDPVVLRGVAFDDAEPRRLLPVLKAKRLSIYATPEAAGLGRPLPGPSAEPSACIGGIDAAVAAMDLGPGGVRVSGRSSGGGPLRRVWLTDQGGVVVGLASGIAPTAGMHGWAGYAVAPVGSDLQAYLDLGDGRPCRLGSATVSAPGTSAPELPRAP